ncbi:MAG: GntR family transcriptional regulator [Clostridia bacterium]|nr:GntR family transcriptional regulator [Clostridia bacterium]
MSFSFKNDAPIYLQIIEHIKMQIISKAYKPNDKLPSVRELSCIYEVNPNTVQKALAELEMEGLIYTERTNGKFVTGDSLVIQKATNDTVDKMVDEFLNSMQSIGISKSEAIKILGEKD